MADDRASLTDDTGGGPGVSSICLEPIFHVDIRDIVDSQDVK